MFSKQDQSQFKAKAIDIKTIEDQLNNFKTGFPKIKLKKPATIDDGISQIGEDEQEIYQEVFTAHAKKLSLLKFVPASGAATRMFKSLYDFLNTYQDTEDEYLKLLCNKGPETMFNFFDRIDDFAFYGDLRNIITENKMDLEKMRDKNKFKQILAMLLTRKGLNYANLPKGLLKFHRYKHYSRTSFEEHLVETLNYTKNVKGDAQIHLTVSDDHKELFEDRLNKTKTTFEDKYNGKLNVAYSVQKSSTDTIAVDINNEPFRNEDGTILFRPGGHGALIENLNELNTDVIFIKNIDNVVPDRLKETTYKFKKVLAGILLECQSFLFDYLKILEEDKNISQDTLTEMLTFLEEKLCTKAPANLKVEDPEKLKKYLFSKFNRPIRVCGMVKNEGEPGGGPFWSRNSDGSVSLQIIEGSQIDKKDVRQTNIFERATHFNPVDLICGIKDYKGDKFNLPKFVDKQTGFISLKSHNGSDLKAMELPGLWNGAMSDWNSVFVEVPIITFNPVKTVFDLLRIEHRNL
ncbi:MAG: NAD metabolism ATPase/kinase [Bacteroidales bacterium]|nr:MAG: NAD metabolism ATPase/kinase [Bacteroidales bacterium]